MNCPARSSIHTYLTRERMSLRGVSRVLHVHLTHLPHLLCSRMSPLIRGGDPDAACGLLPQIPTHEGERILHRHTAHVGTSSCPPAPFCPAESSCEAAAAVPPHSPAQAGSASRRCRCRCRCPQLPRAPSGRGSGSGRVEQRGWGVLGEAAALLIARINNLSRLVSASNRQTSDVVFRRQQRSDQRLQLEGDY